MSKKSFVWEYFAKDDVFSRYAICNLCNKTCKTSGNTSNLRDHLKRTHKIISRCHDSSESDGDKTEPQKKISRQQTIKKCVKNIRSYEQNEKRKLEIDKYGK